MPTNSQSRWWLHSVTLMRVGAGGGQRGVLGPQVRAGAGRARGAADRGQRGARGRPGRRGAPAGRRPAAAPARRRRVRASRYVLLGVVADRDHSGAALIAVDGKPAKPYRVGARVDDGLLLQSVAPRRAVLASSADAPASVTLELPVPTDVPAANTPAAAAEPLAPAIPAERVLPIPPGHGPPSIRQRQGPPGAEIRRP